MFFSYIKTAVRNVFRNRLFSAINMIGLAFGMAVSLLMLIHVKHELSYETFIPDYKNIYRLGTTHWAKVAPSIAEEIKKDIPEVSLTGRLFNEGSSVLTYDGKQISVELNYLADASILEILGLEFIHGDRASALVDKTQIVISENTALKLFGDADPIGKMIIADDNEPLTVMGVFRDLPTNSHLKIETLRSLQDTRVAQNTSKTWKAVATYVKFPDEHAYYRALQTLRSFQVRYLKGELTAAEIEASGDFYEFHPIGSIHLYSHREKEFGSNSNINSIYIFSALAIFIMLIAGVNFVNLFTAQVIKRVREIGVRKVIGATKRQLLFQFLGETQLMAFLSVVLAIIIATAILPLYGDVTNTSLTPETLLEPLHLILISLLAITIGLVSGLYPAFIISRFRVVESLKNKTGGSGRMLPFRKVLVTIQFSSSILVMILTVTAYVQMKFIRDKDLGFKKEKLINVKTYGKFARELRENSAVVKTQLLNHHNIARVAVSSKTIGERFGYETIRLENAPDGLELKARVMHADEDFLETIDAAILESKHATLESDTASVFMLNETAARQLGEKNLIGSIVQNLDNGRRGEIVAIVKDFNFASLHSNMEPMVIQCQTIFPEYLVIRINDRSELGETIAFIEKTIKSISPSTLVVTSLLDDQLDVLYKNENSMFSIFQVFSILSVVIASLGLLAMSAHAIRSRVKEIGIRKVLGATSANLVMMFSHEYTRLILISWVAALPLAYYFVGEWLATFAHRITPSFWMFVAPGILLLFLTVVIITCLSIRTAASNPVNSLRYE